MVRERKQKKMSDTYQGVGGTKRNEKCELQEQEQQSQELSEAADTRPVLYQHHQAALRES